MSKTYEPHVNETKRAEVEDVKRLCKEYKVTGIINLENLPTLMLQRIKKRLGKDVALKITKKRFMKIAFDELKNDVKNVETLKENIKGIPALLFTNTDPFMLYKQLEKSKANAAAKPGQTAPNDLSIEAGATPFAPGPMIGELGMLGIKTEVKDGKIHVKDDAVLVKDGEVISEQVAGLLAKLGVEPMKIGLNLTHTFQDGELLGKSVLAIDEEEYINNIKAAHSESFALALHLPIVNKDTVQLLLAKAQQESLALADGADIMTSGNVGKLLVKAERAASALNEKVPDAPVEEKPAEAKAEEKPAEEKPAEEAKAEPAQEATEAPAEKPAEEPKEEKAEEAKEAAQKPEDVKTNEAAQHPTPQGESQITETSNEMDQVQEIAQKIMGAGVEVKSSETTQVKQNLDPSEVDNIGDVINTLKDRKSKGEI